MSKERKPVVNWILFFATIVVVFFLGLLASSITERRAEQATSCTPEVVIGDWEPRNEVWGLNYPTQYESYKKNSEGDFNSKYNGNAMIDMLEVDPRLLMI